VTFIPVFVKPPSYFESFWSCITAVHGRDDTMSHKFGNLIVWEYLKKALNITVGLSVVVYGFERNSQRDVISSKLP